MRSHKSSRKRIGQALGLLVLSLSLLAGGIEESRAQAQPSTAAPPILTVEASTSDRGGIDVQVLNDPETRFVAVFIVDCTDPNPFKHTLLRNAPVEITLVGTPEEPLTLQTLTMVHLSAQLDTEQAASDALGPGEFSVTTSGSTTVIAPTLRTGSGRTKVCLTENSGTSTEFSALIAAGECRCDLQATLELSLHQAPQSVNPRGFVFDGPGEVLAIHAEIVDHRLIIRVCLQIDPDALPGVYTIRGRVFVYGVDTGQEFDVESSVAISAEDSDVPPVCRHTKGFNEDDDDGKPLPPPPMCRCRVVSAVLNLIPFGMTETEAQPEERALITKVVLFVQTAGLGTVDGALDAIDEWLLIIHSPESPEETRRLRLTPAVQATRGRFAREPCGRWHRLEIDLLELFLQPADAPEPRRIRNFLTEEVPAAWQVAPGEYRASLAIVFGADVLAVDAPPCTQRDNRSSDFDYLREFRLILDPEGNLRVDPEVPPFI